MKQVVIDLKRHSYVVHIASGLLLRAGEKLRELSSSDSCAVLADEAVFRLYGEAVLKTLSGSGFHTVCATQPSGEDHKTLDTVRSFYEVLLDARLDRKAPVLSLGGGVNGDTAGFAASTYLRGVPFVQVPTTLLSMVDASVGGKVGVNVVQGKNLIGSFYQPEAVLIDPSVLASLSEREFRCGIAECIKHGVLGDARLFSWIDANLASILAKDISVLEECIARNVAFKAEIVTADEKEQGIRAHLNLGHTFGHAIEKTTGYGVVKHGEAVSLGMIAASRCAAEMGLCSPELENSLRQILAEAGLPVRARLASNEALERAMTHDKKVQEGKIRFVLPRKLGEVGLYDDVPPECICCAWEAIREQKD